MIPYEPTSVTYIRDPAQAQEAALAILPLGEVGFDTETTGLDPTREGVRMRLASFAAPDGRCWVFDLWHTGLDFLFTVFPHLGLVVGMNIKFDAKFMLKETGIYDLGELDDIMLLGQLLAVGNIYQGFSLVHLAKRYLGIDIGKELQTSDWSKPELTEAQIRYSARDALLPLAIRRKMLPMIRETRQVRVAQLEVECVPAVASMELNGLRLDPERWTKKYWETHAEYIQARDELWELFADGADDQTGTLFAGVRTVNLNSPAQIMRAFERKGLPMPLDKDGNPTTRSYKLKPHEEGHAEVKALLKYRKLSKAIKSYGLNWLPLINPLTGRVHANYRQMGAETGRFSCSKPNLQQIPKRNDYRNCFLAREGWVFVDADYAQFELRILAELCRDPNFVKAFDEGHDLHRYSAWLAQKLKGVEVALEEVSDELRGIYKNLNFGIVYGIGVQRFAENTGLTEEEADQIFQFYFQSYPGMKAWLDRQADTTVRTREARTMTGRLIKYNFDPENKEEVSGVKRNGKNYPLQGTNVDITKRAMKLVYDRIKGRDDILMVHVVHDEIILECRPEVAQEAHDLLVEEMERAAREYLFRVPVKVDCKWTTVWAKDPTPEQMAEAHNLALAA